VGSSWCSCHGNRLCQHPRIRHWLPGWIHCSSYRVIPIRASKLDVRALRPFYKQNNHAIKNENGSICFRSCHRSCAPDPLHNFNVPEFIRCPTLLSGRILVNFYQAFRYLHFTIFSYPDRLLRAISSFPYSWIQE
jgi:hypothetical protein